MRRALTALTMLFAFLLCFAGSGSAYAEFDALNRATWIRNQATGVESTFDYKYDDSGNVRRVEETHQGDVGVTLLDNRVIINDYDETYRLKVESITIAAGSTPTETTYVYDKANNRTSKIVTGGPNPGTEISAYGQITDGYNSNQLKTVTRSGVVTTFLYDANGNRRIKRVGSSTVQTYSYDFDNRLTSLTDNVKGTYAYTYDHRTRRVGRNESSANGGINAKLSFSGGLSVQEYTADPSTPNVETIRGSDYGGGIGGVLYTIRSGVRSYNAYNSRGDVVGQTKDAVSAWAWQAAYEAFGTRTEEDGSTADRQRANTKDEDPTGLLNEGFRYRDREFGIFLTRDPLGFVDGPNVYTYVRQNPWTKFDPLGLTEVESGGSPWDSNTIRSNGNQVLGGGVYDNEATRISHNSAASGNYGGLINYVKSLPEDQRASVKADINAGAQSGNGDGRQVEWIQGNRELMTAGYLAAMGGDGQTKPMRQAKSSTYSSGNTARGIQKGNERQVHLFRNQYPKDAPVPVQRGQLVQVDGKWKVRMGNGELRSAQGQYNYVTIDGKVYVSKKGGHIDVARGKDVDYAGQVSFGSSKNTKGQIREWDNASGHYKPAADKAKQATLPMEKFKEHEPSN